MELPIGEHPFYKELLQPGGWVLDAGCRDFTFHKFVLPYGVQVLAIDPSTQVEDPRIEGVVFDRVALTGVQYSDKVGYRERGRAGHLVVYQDDEPDYAVPCLTIQQLADAHKIKQFDLVKLDIEGAEYDVLLNWPGLIAAQICVEFHDFLGLNPGDHRYPAIFAHLGQWYDIARHVRNGNEDYWDSVFVAKGIL